MQTITPMLWFNNNAEEAIKFYLSIFPNSKLGSVTRTTEAGPGPKGQFLVGSFTLDGQEFTALNGGPHFKFTEAVSFVIDCQTQDEVDHFWNKLTADGGEESMCGWLKDKFGLSWQVTPRILIQLLNHKDKEKAGRVMKAMMTMKKIDIAKLQEAAGEEVVQ
jgi:predicted 3-demethylubiquinone-9 3-methyltransferase (glyoxalase superfamily)